MSAHADKLLASLDKEQLASVVLEQLAAACWAYHLAIKSCADDPRLMDTYCSPSGENLDALYLRWLTLSHGVLHPGRPLSALDRVYAQRWST